MLICLAEVIHMKLAVLNPAILTAIELSAVALVACGGAPDTTYGEPSSSTSEAERAPAQAAAQDSHPDPVVSLDVGNGARVELYDFGEGSVLAMETGKAGGAVTLPKYHDLVQSRDFVRLFTKLRPELAVPSSLFDLEVREKAVHGASPSALTSYDIARRPSGSGGGAHGITADTCANYCCNYSWLANDLCPANTPSDADRSWLLYEYGWSYENDTYVDSWLGAACAVSGTSTFNVSVGGGGGTWSVAEGYYRWFEWDTSGYSNSTTSVNSQSNEHVHSYCGGVGYF
jgi:hypothetical protein